MLPRLGTRYTHRTLRRYATNTVAQRMWMSTKPSVDELKQLQTVATQHPGDPHAQIKLYEKLIEYDPEMVVDRVNQGNFIRTPEIHSMYLQALMMARDGKSFVQATRILSEANSLDRRIVETVAASSANTGGTSRDILMFLMKLVLSLAGAAAFVLLLKGVFMSSSSSIIPMSNIREAESTHTFDEVRGCTEAKRELEDIVEFLKNPQKFTILGGSLPKGVLLTGPPGTGKTLLAKAVAGEAGRPFYFASGSEFEEVFVGVGARRIRDLFETAKANAPCIVFIDEIDAIGGTRRAKELQSMRMTLNQLLVELDGFEGSEGVIVVGATNFPELLDKALVRPGRFDRQVVVPLPDVKGRKEILQLYLDQIVSDDNVDAVVLARGTPGCSGADLRNIVNEAAIEAALRGLKTVNMEILEYAKDKVLMGAERKSSILSQEVREKTAFHEGGHAIMALFTEGSIPIHKATIIPRGQALGMVMQLPESDMLMHSKKELLARLDVCMGGRVAEELIYGAQDVSTGASSDFMQATSIARGMVMHYGMSDAMGKVNHNVDLNQLSPDTRRVIEEEIKRLLDESYDRAKSLLAARKKELNRLATALLEHETLTETEIKSVIAGKKLQKSI